jgi:hypothetical protein
MELDPQNPVVELCAAGMQAEAEGRDDDARALFQRAWDARQNDLEACVAAHFLARQQPDLEQTLHWNRVALAYAEAAGDDQVRGFYPSLHLNLGRCYELLDDMAAARRHHALAATCAPASPRVFCPGCVSVARTTMPSSK